MEHYGILSLFPAVFFLAFALITRKTITAIVLSGASGYIIYYKLGFFPETLDAIVRACTDYDNMWIVLVCLLFGCLIQLLRESKGAVVFGEFTKKYANTQKKGLLATWLLGVIIFIDDYLSILATANTLMPVTDSQKTPREMLAYVINTTSAPVCVIIPISAWVVFFSGIFAAQPEVQYLGDTGSQIYYSIMPYFFYPFLCVLMVPAVILGIIPKMGGMKKAFKRVEETGKLWSPASEMMNKEAEIVKSSQEEKEENGVTPRLWTFVLPMAVVIAITIWQQDILMGVVIGIGTCLLYLPTKVMTFSKFTDCCYKGLEDMLFIAIVLVTSLFYRESMLLIGLPKYVIEVVGPIMSPALLPAVAFVAVGLICFATGSIWSIPALTTPIVIPLAASIGSSLPLTLGAIVSAAIFGAQACFYSDVTLMTSSACRINNVDYGIAQLPYIVIATVISTIAFVIAGIMMAS